jgi:hypothetical protein
MLSSEQRELLIGLYLAGQSPAELAPLFGTTRGCLKELLRRCGVIRSQSEAAKLACAKGKKAKALAALMAVNKTTNRFNPNKTPWAGRPEMHPLWRKDRSTLKRKRGRTEERQLFKEALAKADYTCSLTGVRGCKLSVHHVEPVWQCPVRQFDPTNVVVIQRTIHKHFHKMFGNKATAADWRQYVQEGSYLAFCQRQSA